MATPGDLVRIYADALRIPKVTVGAYYRSLREADLVTKGGTGRSAPKSTPRDAGKLLVALLGANGAVDADEAAMFYSAIPYAIEYDLEGEVIDELTPIDTSPFHDLDFVSAVTLVIDSFHSIVAELDSLGYQGDDRLAVAAVSTTMDGEIRIGKSLVLFHDDHLSSGSQGQGMQVRRFVNEPTLQRIAEIFHSTKAQRR